MNLGGKIHLEQGARTLPRSMYSPASVAKKYIEKIEVKPFLEKNPDFPKEILGYLMRSYYGGRTEVRIRKKPVKISYLDFTSMHSTMFVLMKMNQFLTSDKITFKHNKAKIQEFLDAITLEDVNKPQFWHNLVTICKIKPDNDILPVRSSFGGGKARNIGVNYLKSTDGVSLWYTASDLIASKLLTGHTPTIEKAITFVPIGIQQTLPNEKIDIFKGVTINPRKEISLNN